MKSLSLGIPGVVHETEEDWWQYQATVSEGAPKSCPFAGHDCGASWGGRAHRRGFHESVYHLLTIVTVLTLLIMNPLPWLSQQRFYGVYWVNLVYLCFRAVWPLLLLCQTLKSNQIKSHAEVHISGGRRVRVLSASFPRWCVPRKTSPSEALLWWALRCSPSIGRGKLLLNVTSWKVTFCISKHVFFFWRNSETRRTSQPLYHPNNGHISAYIVYGTGSIVS